MPVPDYRTLKPQKKAVPEITEKDINYLMEEFTRKFGSAKEVDRTTQQGDQVVIDYSARDEEGILQMAGKGERFIVGNGVLFPAFEQSLLNHKKGDTIKSEVLVPADHFAKPLQGKTLVFEATIVAVEEIALAPMDDQLAVQALGEGKTLVDLKQVLTEELKFEREERIARTLIDEFFNNLFEAVKSDVNEEEINKEIDRLLEAAYRAAEEKGIKREEYDAKLKQNGVEPRKQIYTQAHRTVALRNALEEILKSPEFEVKDEEVIAAFEAEMRKGSPEEQERARAELDSKPVYFEQIRNNLQMEKLYLFIES